MSDVLKAVARVSQSNCLILLGKEAREAILKGWEVDVLDLRARATIVSTWTVQGISYSLALESLNQQRKFTSMIGENLRSPGVLFEWLFFSRYVCLFDKAEILPYLLRLHIFYILIDLNRPHRGSSESLK